MHDGVRLEGGVHVKVMKTEEEEEEEEVLAVSRVGGQVGTEGEERLCH